MAVENLAYKTDKTHQELPPNVAIQSSSNHSYSYNQPAIQTFSCIQGYSQLCLKFSALVLRFFSKHMFRKNTRLFCKSYWIIF